MHRRTDWASVLWALSQFADCHNRKFYAGSWRSYLSIKEKDGKVTGFASPRPCGFPPEV